MLDDEGRGEGVELAVAKKGLGEVSALGGCHLGKLKSGVSGEGSAAVLRSFSS